MGDFAGQITKPLIVSSGRSRSVTSVVISSRLLLEARVQIVTILCLCTPVCPVGGHGLFVNKHRSSSIFFFCFSQVLVC